MKCPAGRLLRSTSAGTELVLRLSSLYSGFYLVDEPDPAVQTPANLKAESDWIHANDPGAKTFIVLNNQGPDLNPSFAYNAANTDIDLFGIDPYPVQTQYNGANYSIIAPPGTAPGPPT